MRLSPPIKSTHDVFTRKDCAWTISIYNNAFRRACNGLILVVRFWNKRPLIPRIYILIVMVPISNIWNHFFPACLKDHSLSLCNSLQCCETPTFSEALYHYSFRSTHNTAKVFHLDQNKLYLWFYCPGPLCKARKQNMHLTWTDTRTVLRALFLESFGFPHIFKIS